MDDNSKAILSRMNQSIVIDDVNLVGPIIVDQLEKSPDWANIGRQLLFTAVIHRSSKIIHFMVNRFLRLLSGDWRYKVEIFRSAIDCFNFIIIDLFLKDDVHFIDDIGQSYYDYLIVYAYKKLEIFKLPELNNYQLENLKCLRLIIKSLLEYPRNRYNDHGIVLEVDGVTLEVTVSNNNTLDINKPIVNNHTVLRIWINRGTEACSDGSRTSPYIRTVIFSIIRYLIKHFAKMDALNEFISTNNIHAIVSNYANQLYKTHCASEIKRMVDMGFMPDVFISIFDILIASKDNLAQFVMHSSVRNIILSKSFIQIFPIYGRDIVKSFEKLTNEQRRLMNLS